MSEPQTDPRQKTKTAARPIWFAIGVLFLAYLVQLHSPLRVNTDAVTILRLTANLTDGQPYLLDGARPLYPIGIPLAYSFMERIGLADSFGFGLFNLICICVAAYSTWIICRAMPMGDIATAAVILISFSSFVLIKHSVLPLTDIPYMAVSLSAIAAMEILATKAGGAKIRWIFVASLCFVAAILVRRVGIALLPALLYALIPSKASMGDLQRTFSARKALMAGIAAAALVALVGLIIIRRILYVPDFRFSGSFAEAVKGQIWMRMNDFGELVINAPAAKLGRLRFVVLIAGPILLVLIIFGLWQWRRHLRPAHVYLIFYMAILALWPFIDARFWIPVLPLITITVCQALARMPYPAVVRCLTILYLVGYAVSALVAVGYTTRITFSGTKFAEVYGTGAGKLAYEHAWAGQASEPGNDWTAVIHRYGMSGAPK